jgi:diguanylate cyclase (GGDEF)-like protein
MGRVLPEATREIDIVARYGGEEFIALLPECDLENGIRTGERIRERLAKESFDGRTVTISVGVAEFPTHGDAVAAVVAAADESLYRAKREGRDRVVGAPPRSAEETEQRASKRAAAARKKRVASDS